MTTAGRPVVRRRAGDPLGRLLVATTAAACRPTLDPDAVALARRTPYDVMRDLPALATAHRVEGCVHSVLERVDGVARSVLEELAAGRRVAASHHLVVRGMLTRVGEELDGAGIPWLVFKGPAVVSTLYGGDPGLRRYSDLDLLVPPDRFAEAVAVLVEAGARPVARWAPLVYFRSGSISFAFGRIQVDLHWHVVYKVQDRRWYRIDPEQMFARRRTIDVGGQRCATFDEVDTALHLALHAAREGCHRLVWLKDVERAVAVGRPDLDELVRRAREAHCAAPVGIALARSRWALGTAVRDDVVRSLVGRAWPAVVRAVTSRDDLDSRRPRASLGTILTRETRTSIPRTVARAVLRVRDRRAEQRFTEAFEAPVDVAPSSLSDRARNDADRGAYFEVVRNWRAAEWSS